MFPQRILSDASSTTPSLTDAASFTQSQSTPSLQTSLEAPSRIRSVSVDDRLHEQPQPRPITSLPISTRPRSPTSSESDDDEFDCSALQVSTAPKRRRLLPPRRMKHIRSDLSLDSYPSDLDSAANPSMSMSRNVVPTTSVPHLECPAPTADDMQMSVASEQQREPSSKQLTISSPAIAQSVSTPPVKLHSQSPNQDISNTSNTDPINSTLAHQQSQSLNTSQARPNSHRNASVPTSSDDLQVVSERMVHKASNTLNPPPMYDIRIKNMTGKHLTNIPVTSPSDSLGWDRFIFFSHRPQRFEFKDNVYLSMLSPFSASVAAQEPSHLNKVCGVCGGSQQPLLTCSRCCLGFHKACMNGNHSDGRRFAPNAKWMCIACTSAKANDPTNHWNVDNPPKLLPPPSMGLQRVIEDAREGNPIDSVLNPSLFNLYVKEVGVDWLRCFRCKRIRKVREGVLSESVQAPFECSLAFWDDDSKRVCGLSTTSEEVRKVEKYLKNRSRMRNAFMFHCMGEEDREDFGLEPIDPSEIEETLPEKVVDVPEEMPEENIAKVVSVEVAPANKVITGVERLANTDTEPLGVSRDVRKESNATTGIEGIAKCGDEQVSFCFTASGSELVSERSTAKTPEVSRAPDQLHTAEEVAEVASKNSSVKDVAKCGNDVERLDGNMKGIVREGVPVEKSLSVLQAPASTGGVEGAISSVKNIGAVATAVDAGNGGASSGAASVDDFGSSDPGAGGAKVGSGSVVRTNMVGMVAVPVASTGGEASTSIEPRPVASKDTSGAADSVAANSVAANSSAADEREVKMLELIGSMGLGEDVVDKLVELALKRDDRLDRLYQAFGQKPHLLPMFKRQAQLLVNTERSAVSASPPLTPVAVGGQVEARAQVIRQRQVSIYEQSRQLRLQQIAVEKQHEAMWEERLLQVPPRSIPATMRDIDRSRSALRKKHEEEFQLYIAHLCGQTSQRNPQLQQP